MQVQYVDIMLVKALTAADAADKSSERSFIIAEAVALTSKVCARPFPPPLLAPRECGALASKDPTQPPLPLVRRLAAPSPAGSVPDI